MNQQSLLDIYRRSEVKSLSCVRLFVTPWTVAHQAPPSLGFSRQEYWSGVPLPSPLVTGKRNLHTIKLITSNQQLINI